MAKLHRAVLPLLLSVSAAACGGDDGGLQPPTEDGLRAAAEEQARAFIDNPANTYQYLSADCRDSVSRSDWAGQMLLAMGFFESFAGFKLSDANIGEVEVRNVDGSRGEAKVELLDPDGQPFDDEDDFGLFLYEDGAWRSTDCETFDVDDDETDESDDEGDQASDTTIGGELRPADEVSEEQARAAATAGSLGQSVELTSGISITVSGIEFDEDQRSGSGDDFTIAVTLRVENRSGEDGSNPEVLVTCANVDETGSWYTDSTFDMYGDLPSGSFSEGELILGVPVGCNDPVVRASAYDEFYDDVAVDWAVPADVHP